MESPLTSDENEGNEEKQIKIDDTSNDEQSKRLGELIRSKKKLSMVLIF
jgi:hypothetical protein